jgi:two-component system invasion response regulator UvrY
MEKKRIIIIDDRPLLRDAWSVILESNHRYEVIGKYGKSTGLVDTLRSQKPDLVILDIGITQLNEFPIIKLIRKYSPLTKIIAVSVQLESSYATKLIRAGASGFLNMDCQATELRSGADIRREHVSISH